MSEDEATLKSLLMHAGFHNAQSPYMAQGGLVNFRALLDLARDHQWRPMTTAPKDGTFVLCGMPSGYVMILQWCQDQYWRTGRDEKVWFPQVWQPLPRYNP